MQRLHASIRGTRQYAKELFRDHAGDRTLVVMRDRRSGRITGVRTHDGRVIYRPKGGKQGIIANLEVIMDNFLYNPILLYAANNAVHFVPYTNGILNLSETAVTDQHWSMRK